MDQFVQVGALPNIYQCGENDNKNSSASRPFLSIINLSPYHNII